MITGLVIRGLGVIEEAQVDLGPGLTVITGETGAGKTMVLTGLGLLLGGRTDPGAVREGHAQAVAEGRFSIPTESTGEIDLNALLAEAGGELDEDDSLLVARTVSKEGRSRAHLGGRSVPAAVLTEAGRALVAVHGQDDQHRLLQPSRQRDALDRFAGPDLTTALETYRHAFRELQAVRARIERIVSDGAGREREAEDLTQLITLLDSVNPLPGEEESLRIESERLGHVEELARAARSAEDALRGDADAASDSGAIDSIGDAGALLARAGARDPLLKVLAERLSAVQAEVDDVSADLARYVADLDAEPGRLAWVEERRASLAALRRRLLTRSDLGGMDDPARVRALLEQARAEVADDAGLLAELRARESSLLPVLAGTAAEVSALRKEAAERLATAVTAELHALAMPSATLQVDVARRSARSGMVALSIDGRDVGADAHGIDEVEFLLVPREGAPPRPLGKGASGGERSRIMLAVEVVFARVDPVPTFVFDEVDAGVGGKAAVEVGRRLRRLGTSAQVIVVTHLPQVAAFGTRHLVVQPGQAVTSSGVVEVSGEARVAEIARMLAGQESSSTARAHAEELLALAASEDADSPAGRSVRRGGRR